ncbi:MAG: RspH10B [Paenibacillus sp.]|nr:RspH10B [Paenibacillus sp.]
MKAVHKFRQRFAVGIISAAILCGFGEGAQVQAALTFTVSDTVTAFPSPYRTGQIVGNEMIWRADDQWGRTQVFYRNLETGDTKQLTDTDGEKSYAHMGGNYMAMIHYASGSRDVVLYDLRTGEAKKLNPNPGIYEHPSTDGRYVAYYHNDTDQSIYVYDIALQTSKAVAKGRIPVLAEGKLLFQQTDGSLGLYDVQKDELRTVLKAPKDGYIDGLTGVAFNGRTAVWLQNQHKGGTEARMLQVNEPDARPKVLSSSSGKKRSIAPVVIGDRMAAWMQSVDGKDQIVAADLTYGKSNVLTNNEKEPLLIGMYRDQVVLKGEDSNLIYRAVQVSGEPEWEEEELVSAVPEVDRVPQSVSKPDHYFYEGGELVSSDGSAKLTIDKDTDFEGYGDLKLSIEPEKELHLTKAMVRGQKMLSLPWRVDFPAPYSGVELALSFDRTKVAQDQQNKLGIYRLEDSSWVYMGGLFPDNTNQLYTTIIKPGVYTVLLYDVPNEYVREYWIGKRLAQYNEDAAIRVFLDGEEITFDETPRLKDGSTTVQFRPIFEKLGLSIAWDDATQTITGKKEGRSLQLTLEKDDAIIDGASSQLPVAPYLHNGHTFVPLRYIGEATGRKVVWDSNLMAVYLYAPETEGKLYYPDGKLKYEGQLDNGHMNGKGKLYREDGTLWYDAEFVNDEVKGWGTIYFDGFSRGRDRAGETGIGQFAQGRPHGYVRYFDDSGYMQYEGYVQQGIFNGKGKYYIENQLIYEGEFKNNLYHGYGKYYIGGKLHFEGNYVENGREGWGKEYDKTGRVLREGEYKNHYLNGKGIVYYPSGAIRLDGQFVNDRAHGPGKAYDEQGRLRIEGEFEKSYLKKATLYYENGERYEGEFRNEVPHGEGTMYDKDGKVKHKGKFENGKPVSG